MEQPLYCEIAGAPGSGKTTLARALCRDHGLFHARMPLDRHEPRALRFYIRNAVVLAPVLLSLVLGRGRRRLRFDEFYWLIFLNGWPRELRRTEPASGVVVLDQGPVYMFSQLILSRGAQLDNRGFAKWWAKTLERWGMMLDLIVRLDAADNDLVRRVNLRDQDHIVKGAPPEEILRFIERSRGALDRAQDLIRQGTDRPRILRFDTGRLAATAVAAEIRVHYAGNPEAR